jgi:hypothetical protein
MLIRNVPSDELTYRSKPVTSGNASDERNLRQGGPAPSSFLHPSWSSKSINGGFPMC